MADCGEDWKSPPHRTIRVLAMMESQWVTGPAKNLIAFASHLRDSAPSNGPVVEVSVVTFGRPSSPVGRFVAALDAAGIRNHVIRERRAADPNVIPQLLAIIRSEKPDIIQTHNSKSHLLIRFARLWMRVPWVAFFHGFTTTNTKDRFYNRIGWWALRGAPRIVTVCRAFADDLVRSGVPESRISVRHNIVAPFVQPQADEVAALRSRLGIPGDCRVALTVGRLSKEKGHADLIDALAHLNGAGGCSTIRFVIVGDGPERSELERRARESGIADLVLFAGHQNEVGTYYGMADAFVLPSHTEGSPNALLEAMSAGLPIVSTDAGGAAELVSNGNTALVVERRAPQSLSRAIGRLLEDRQLASRLSASAQRAARGYTPEAYSAALIEVYRAVAGIRLIRPAG